jgi:phosphoglycolate phosphatase
MRWRSSPQQPVPLLVFDLDGTLIDSQRDLTDAANALIVERAGAPQPVDAIANMVGEGAALLVQRALAAAGLDPDSAGALARFLELYDERLLVHTRLYEGIEPMLRAVAPAATLAVLTNKPQRQADRILEGTGIAPWFRWVIGGDGPIGRKPDPAGLRSLMERAGCERSETLMIGDSAIDLATARAAGAHVCLARYGFGYRFGPGDLRGDELIAGTPLELLRILHAHLRSPPSA